MAILIVHLFVPTSVLADGPGAFPAVKPTADVVMDDATRKSTAKALAWLASKQNPDGSWTASQGMSAHKTGITSFVMLAFLSQGHLPNQGKYGVEMTRATRFLLASQRQDGYLVGSSGGNMYCHGMATLALAELWGMTGDQEIKPALKKAVDLIIGCQCRSPKGEGGWRYTPTPIEADISVTIMQVMALRAAKNGGIHVPDDTLDKAIKYVMRCRNAQSGGFAYQPGSPPGFARTAAGICVLQLTMKYDTRDLGPQQLKEKAARQKAITEGVKYLGKAKDARIHYWYGQYYAAHALHQVGGKEWSDYYKSMRQTLLQKQSADGSWASFQQEVGPIYNTAIAVIILSVPQNCLPIFQK